ncbi:MAG TPA: ATP-dependent 6-phosphofructokinase [Planctomycetota bacterium]|nr:ATP-dependent 6-phosphofructokinase [Planctomycetota bacterium]
MQIKRVGLLTGGGDAPALNAFIRAAVVRLIHGGASAVGIADGWRGMIDASGRELSPADVAGIAAEGGTILGASRTNPFKNPERDLPRIAEGWCRLGLDALIAVGGDDTLGVAERLHRESGLGVVGVPKSIDNDLPGTDCAFGFHSAVEAAARAMDDLAATARAHRRVLVVECMGRHSGWIAAYAGVAAGADYVVVPEEPLDVAGLCRRLTASRAAGRQHNIVAVAEGVELGGELVTADGGRDDFDHERLGGVGELLARLIAMKTGLECRHVVLGHLQRAGRPTAFDRILATRYGVFAAEMALAGQFGRMAVLRGSELAAVPMDAAVGRTRPLDEDFRKMMRMFFTG